MTADAARAWAAAVLEVPADASPGEVTSALLAHVQEEEFNPEPDFEVAFDVLTAPDASAWHDGESRHVWRAGVEARLREELQKFTAGYFDIPPEVRQEVWQVLRDRTASFPGLRGRVERLTGGLIVVRPEQSSDDSAIAQLLRLIEDCYLATPSEAARLRRSARARIREQIYEWKTAVQWVRKFSPAYAKIGLQHLDWVVCNAVYSAKPIVQVATLPGPVASRKPSSVTHVLETPISSWWLASLILPFVLGISVALLGHRKENHSFQPGGGYLQPEVKIDREKILADSRKAWNEFKSRPVDALRPSNVGPPRPDNPWSATAILFGFSLDDDPAEP